MKCKKCNNEIGNVKEVYFSYCKISKIGIGMMFANEFGEIVYWVSDKSVFCKSCRPNTTFTHRNWTLAKAKM